jgi:hypothetical protein
MYLYPSEVLGIMIILVVASTIVITTAIANARLTRSRDEWRTAYYNLKNDYELEHQRIEQGW